MISSPIFALSSDWEEKFLIPSMARSTNGGFDIVRRLDHSGKIDGSLQDKKQKTATAMLRDELHQHDFAKPIS